MIVITGSRSTIAKQLLGMVPETAWCPDRGGPVPLDAERYFFCQGYLAGEAMRDITPDQLLDTMLVNYSMVRDTCDRIIDVNPKARIVVMGSESGFAGSYDESYAAAKALLHRYVETKRLLHPGQQLVAIAPTVIEDTRMTAERKDLADCMARGAARRRERWLLAVEVARLVHFLLYQDTGSISNTVIRQHGGTW